MSEEQSEGPCDAKTSSSNSRKLPDDPPREVDGLCSRCGAAWPCLRCLTSTPPYVHVWNNI